MEKKCNNCEYFKSGSPEYYLTFVWGDCMKPGKYTWDTQDTKTPGVFMWGNKSCDDFEPRKTPADQPAQDFL